MKDIELPIKIYANNDKIKQITENQGKQSGILAQIVKKGVYIKKLLRRYGGRQIL